MQIEKIRVLQERPDDEDLDLHEFGLIYYRFLENESDMDSQEAVQDAVWVRFSEASQIETLRFQCPDAKLGPVESFTEALILAASPEEAETLCKKIERLYIDSEMKEVFDEDTLEDI